jgi:hypothetical protein
VGWRSVFWMYMQIELEKDEPYIHKCFALISLRLAYRKPRAFEPLLSLEYVHGNDESCMNPYKINAHRKVYKLPWGIDKPQGCQRIKTPTLCREGNKSRVGNGEKILLTTTIILICQMKLVFFLYLLQHHN